MDVGMGDLAGPGLFDGRAEPAGSAQCGAGFRGVFGEVEDLVPTEAHEGRGNPSQLYAKSFGLRYC